MDGKERLIQANGVELCIETFGKADDPAILLVHGACASMLWWETELCEMIAARGRFVIRYDSRDTGRSTNYPPGEPGYSLNDMVQDVLAIFDSLEIERAHIVGRSMGGAIALALGVDHPNRVASLTFATTTSGHDNLPPMSDEFIAYTSSDPDFDDPDKVVDYVTGLMRVFSGGSPYFDEPAARTLAARDVARTKNMAAALTNHFRIAFDAPKNGGLGDVEAPTLIVHGEVDPVFPLAHGEALRNAIPGSILVVLPKAGHEIPRALWELFVNQLVGHTKGGGRLTGQV